MTSKITTLLFDLDGTLLDTAHDLLTAFNTLLARHQRAPMAMQQFRGLIGQGSRGILTKSFALTEEHSQFAHLRAEFFALYKSHCCDSTQLFSGMSALLDYLQQHNLPWGIVTNKTTELSMPILASLDLVERYACFVGADQVCHPKPHPQALLLACKRLRAKPENCLFLGDAEQDVIAGRAAGMTTAVALYGYIAEDVDPRHWHADLYFQKPLDLQHWLAKKIGL